MTWQGQSYLLPPVADSLEGDSIGLSLPSITMICAEARGAEFDRCTCCRGIKSDVGSRGCRQGSVQFQRESRGDPGIGVGMCVPSLRAGGLSGLEEGIAWTLVAWGRVQQGKLGRLERAFATWCGACIRSAGSEC